MSKQEKTTGFFAEFKQFIARGNVMDMAVGVIIGGAFKAIADSLVADIINPILGIFAGGNSDLSNLALHLPGGGDLMLGNFINAILNFLIMAFVIFCIVKAMNKLMEMGKHEEPAAEELAAPAAPTQEELLAEILVELKKQNGEKTA